MFLTPSFQALVAAATAQFQNVQSSVVGLGERRGGGVCVWVNQQGGRSPYSNPLLSRFLPQFRAARNLLKMVVTKEKEAVMALGRTQAMGAGRAATPWGFHLLILGFSLCTPVSVGVPRHLKPQGQGDSASWGWIVFDFEWWLMLLLY